MVSWRKIRESLPGSRDVELFVRGQWHNPSLPKVLLALISSTIDNDNDNVANTS